MNTEQPKYFLTTRSTSCGRQKLFLPHLMESHMHSQKQSLIKHPSKGKSAKINQRLRWSGFKEDIVAMNFNPLHAD